jgi:hypothetical protein
MDNHLMGRFLSRAIALFIVFLFIMIVSVSAYMLAFRESLINVETYKETLVNQNVYEDIVPYIIPVLLENNQTELNSDESFSIDLNDIDQFMSVDDWRRVSNELIPAEWLQNQTESILDSINLIKQGDFSRIENVVDLSEVVERLQGTDGKLAAEIIINSAPDCSTQQINQLRQFDGESGSTFPICNPPLPRLTTKAANLISDWFSNVGVEIKTQIRQQHDTLSIPEEVAGLIHNLFQLDSQLSLLFLLCPMSLLGLIILLGIRNLKSFGRWLGWAFILSGIMTMILIFTSQIPVFASFDEVVAANTETERFTAQIYAGFVRSVYTDASATMLIIAGIMIGIGFVLLVVSMLGQSRNFIVPEGTVLVTEDGRIVSTTRPQRKTVILPKDNP